MEAVADRALEESRRLVACRLHLDPRMKKVNAIRVPALDDGEEEANLSHIAALGEDGEWIALDSGTAGFEAAALANIAAAAGNECALACEESLLAAAAPSLWTVTKEPDLDESRALAAISMILAGEDGARISLGLVNAFLIGARRVEARPPWNNPRLLAAAEPFHAATSTSALEKFTLSITPPADCCPAAWVHFERVNREQLTLHFGSAPAAEFLERFLARRGFASLPTAYIDNRATDRMRVISTADLAKLALLLDVLDQGAARAGVFVSNLSTKEIGGCAQWSVLPPSEQRARRGPRVGRNEPCHCGSGKKYKKCHLMADQVSSLSPQLAARPGAGNRTEVIVATDGKPVPEGGYDDCAICQA